MNMPDHENVFSFTYVNLCTRETSQPKFLTTAFLTILKLLYFRLRDISKTGLWSDFILPIRINTKRSTRHVIVTWRLLPQRDSCSHTCCHGNVILHVITTPAGTRVPVRNKGLKTYFQYPTSGDSETTEEESREVDTEALPSGDRIGSYETRRIWKYFVPFGTKHTFWASCPHAALTTWSLWL